MDIKLETKVGILTVDSDNSTDYPNLTIKLDNIPIVLIENNKDKIIIKKYPNKKVVQDDDYINLDYFGINENEIDKIFIEEDQ